MIIMVIMMMIMSRAPWSELQPGELEELLLAWSWGYDDHDDDFDDDDNDDNDDDDEDDEDDNDDDDDDELC